MWKRTGCLVPNRSNQFMPKPLGNGSLCLKQRSSLEKVFCTAPERIIHGKRSGAVTGNASETVWSARLGPVHARSAPRHSPSQRLFVLRLRGGDGRLRCGRYTRQRGPRPSACVRGNHGDIGTLFGALTTSVKAGFAA